MKISDPMRCLSGGAAVALFLLFPAGFQAPAGAATKALPDRVRTGAIVEKAAYRRCSWRQGVRYCGGRAQRPRARQRDSGYGYDYGTPLPEFYPFGSEGWWLAMERDGRVFRGP